MPIRRHGNGFEVRVQHAGRRFSRTVATHLEARNLEAKLRAQVGDHKAGRLPSHTTADAIERWSVGEASGLRSRANLANKVDAMRDIISNRPLAEIAEIAEEVKRQGIANGLRPATINRRLAILRRVARLAHREWQWIDHDVAARIKLLPGEEPRYVQATPTQIEALLLAAEGELRRAILWAALTGLRKSELLALRPDDLADGMLTVRRSKTGRPRRVPLAPDLLTEPLPQISEATLNEEFRAARARAGMPWLQFRDLRRTFGSWIIQRTGSLRAAQELLGHTTPVITARHYAHLLEGDLRASIATLPRVSAGLARGRKKRPKTAKTA